MNKFGTQFVPTGEIAVLRRGVTSGCDAFFMPNDVTDWALDKFDNEHAFKKRYGLSRISVEKGVVKIVRAGDGSEHPIETEYLAPEVHSLRDFQRCVLRTSDCDRVILMVNKRQTDVSGTWVGRYLRYGETHKFASAKSKPVVVPKRTTCAARDPWYDLTKVTKPGMVFCQWRITIDMSSHRTLTH
jgi:hypothetical protein